MIGNPMNHHRHTPAPAPTPATVSPHTVSFQLSEDSFRGHAQFIARFDGQTLTTATVTAAHSLGQSQTFTFGGNWGEGPHTFQMEFLNDTAKPSPIGADRNLYLEGITYDGHAAGSTFPIQVQFPQLRLLIQ